MTSAFRALTAIISLLLVSPLAASAQDVTPPATQKTAPVTPPAAPTNQPLLKPAEIEALVAPIALYPDDLLSLVLMASTYPLEVVEAQRWLEANKKLSDAQRKSVLDKQDWDQSVKSLIATPSVLETMSTQLQWTRKLGDAVLAQESDVMDAVQRLRARAHAKDKLVTTKQQRVRVQKTGTRQVIAIEPVDPNVIYVPYYEPAVVFGDWLYPDYPPYFFADPGYYYPGAVLAAGIWFGVGYALGYWGGVRYWGGSCNWNNNNLYYRNGRRWEHRPEHRRGVKYSSDRMQQKFGDRRADRARSGDRMRAGDRANRRDAARTRDARQGRAARTRQATRARSGQRAAQRSVSRNRAAQRQRAQRSRVSARQASRARMSARGGGRSAFRGGGGRNFRAVGGGGRSGFRGGGGFHGGGRVAFRGGGGGFRGGGGGGFRGGGGGGFRGGGGGGFRGGGGGGGRRSDIRLKEDFALVGRLDSGLGLYRFRYHGDPRTYVGVMAQDVRMVQPDAVTRGRDGYLRVRYDRIGFELQPYDTWDEHARKAQGL